MNVKIIDSSSLKIQIPVIADGESLKRQFNGRVAGNDDHLKRVYTLLNSWSGQDLSVSMVLVEAKPLVGSSPSELVSCSCDSVGFSPDSLAKPSLAQIGILADLFRYEQDVERVIPITDGGKITCISWERVSWPYGRAPVFRLYDSSPVHNTVWMMLPVAYG